MTEKRQRAKMAYAKLVFLVMLGLNSTQSLGETEPHHLPQNCPRRKCPPGYSSFCLQNGQTRCIPCKEGTFSTHASRRKACRPCSRCNDNEFELRPCTATLNVVCKKCRPCPPGFGRVEKSCEGTRDSVCEKCREPVSGIQCNNTGSQITDDVLGLKTGRKGKENARDSSFVTTVKVVEPWLGDTIKPIKHQNKTLSKFQGVRPTSSNDYAAAAQSIKFHSVHSVSSATSSALAPENSIGPSFSPVSSNPTIMSQSGTSAKKTLKHVDIMQGDEPNVPRHTRRNAEENSTTVEISVTPPLHLSRSPSNDIKTKNTLMGLDVHGLPEGFSTTAFTMKTDVDNVNITLADNGDSRESKPLFHRLWAVVAIPVVVAAFLVLIGVSRSKLAGTEGCFFSWHSRIRSRRPRCPGSSDCCDGDSESSVVESNGEQTESRIPASVRTVNEAEDLPNSGESTPVTYQQTQVTADVHRTVFDSSPDLPGAYPQFVTRAEAVFDSCGGKLSAPGSNVSINVESGAVPDGVSQRFFFGVVYDDTLLLRDIPETSESSLISPVIQCGPEDIDLVKPVDIVLPHCLYVDEVKKTSISVYRCKQYSEKGPMNWEKVPSASEKNCQSKAWFRIKKDTIHIRTKTFSFWSVFTCGGPKRKRATVFVSKPNPHGDLLYLRFYICSDNEDSKKRMERKEKEQFPDSKQAIEKPFKMYNDSKNIFVWLNPEDLAASGWVLDKTPASQIYNYQMAYKNGYRSYDSCSFAVKPITTSQVSVNDFSCKLSFQQEDHPEHFIYVNPGFPLVRQTIRRFSVQSTSSKPEHHATGPTPETSSTEAAKDEDQIGRDDEMVTEAHCHRICRDIGAQWKPVLRNLGLKEKALENLDEDFKSSKVDEKCYQGLLEWMRNCDSQKATTKTLCEALRLAGCAEALKTLSEEAGVGRSFLSPIQESTAEKSSYV